MDDSVRPANRRPGDAANNRSPPPHEKRAPRGPRLNGMGRKKGAPRRGCPRGAPAPEPAGYGSSAVHRSAAPCSPTGWPRSTIGARRLSFRVRNGSGRAPPAMAADRWAALVFRRLRASHDEGVVSACPGGRTASSPDRISIIDLSCTRQAHAAAPAGMRRVRARAISAARLRLSPALHLRPINQVVYLGPYRKEN